MTQDHFHYNIDDSVKSLTFINPFPGSGEQHVKVEALIHRNGQWTRPPEDWTAEDRVHLCLDREGEDVDELVIIISNSDHADRGHTFDVGPAELVASPLGCVGWSGTATAEVQYFDARFNITLDNVLFAPSPQDTDPNDRYDGYVLAQSSAAIWHASGTWPGGCTASGTMSLDPPGQGPSDVGGSLVIDREELDYQVHIGGHRDYAVFQLLCGDDTADQLWPVIPIAYNAAGSELVDENGELVADGEYIDPSETYGGTWRWRFEEVK